MSWNVFYFCQIWSTCVSSNGVFWLKSTFCDQNKWDIDKKRMTLNKSSRGYDITKPTTLDSKNLTKELGFITSFFDNFSFFIVQWFVIVFYLTEFIYIGIPYLQKVKSFGPVDLIILFLLNYFYIGNSYLLNSILYTHYFLLNL